MKKYEIKTNTKKRFCLGWLKQAPQGRKFRDHLGRQAASDAPREIEIAGLGGIEYALKVLNGELVLDKPSRIPEFAGVEGGPLSPLDFWFEIV